MTERIERTQDLYLIDMTEEGVPAEEGQIRYVDADIKAFVGGQVVSLVTGNGISEIEHQHLDTLVHWIDQTSYDEVVRIGGKVTSIITWDSIAKTRKIREEIIARTGGKVSQVVAHQYNRSTGVLKETLTEDMIRTGGKITAIIRNSDVFPGGLLGDAGLPETTTAREMDLTTVAAQSLYLIPLGDHFLNAASETEVVYNGTSYRLDSGFYSHVHRSLAGYMNVADAMIGILLTTPPPGGVPLKIRWKQRSILVAPQTLALVHCKNFSGVWRPDYTLPKWNQNDNLLAPNAIQVPMPPAGYVVEWWRLSQRKGGGHTSHGSGYRAGKRFLPILRGPAVGTENSALFLATQFDIGSESRPWRHFRVCYYNPTTGARSSLSSEVVVSSGYSGTHPDQHNGLGPSRYNLWINR